MRPRKAPAAVAICLAASSLAASPACAEGPTAGSGGPPALTATPDPALLAEAKRHMKAGAAFYNDPRGHKCEEALKEFRKAYQLSGSLNAIKGMAICNLELERDGDSIDLYQAYLAGKGPGLDPAERAQVEADLNALRAVVALVTLSSSRAGVRVTDVRTPARGYPIRNVYTLPPAGRTLGLHPGQHVFTAASEGAPDQVWQTEISNGGTYAHAFVFGDTAAVGPGPRAEPLEPLAPLAPQPRPVPAAVFVTGGLTLALAVPWAILAVRAKNENDQYNSENGKENAVTLSTLRGDVKNANLLADIFLGATLASLTATAVLFFARPSAAPAGPGPGPGPGGANGKARSFNNAPPRFAVGVSSGGAVASGWF